MRTHVQAARDPSHLYRTPENPKLPFQRDVPAMFPKCHSSNGDTTPQMSLLCSGLQAKLQVAACVHTSSLIPPSSPTLESLHLLAHDHPQTFPHCLQLTLPSAQPPQLPRTILPLPIPRRSIHPTSSKGVSRSCSCSLGPQPHLAPPGPGHSHLLAKKAPTVTRAPSATAPVSTVLTDAQVPSRRRRASSRARSPYRAVNSAQPPVLWIQSASCVSR